MIDLASAEAGLLEFAKTVDLSATQFFEGFHRSHRGSQGVEFHSSVPYSFGEDLRALDWKRFAASDRFYVNRFQKEEKSGWAIWIDQSESMNYGKKKEWARLWAGALLFLANVWSDRWILLPHLEFSIEEAFRELSKPQSPRFGFSNLSSGDLPLVPTRDRLVIFSDFFYNSEGLINYLRDASQIYSKIYLLQVLDPREEKFDFDGVIEFEDMESADRLILDSKMVRKRYQEHLEQLRSRLRASLNEESLFFAFPSEGEKLEAQLTRFFDRIW